MAAFVLRRLFFSIFVIWGAITVIFIVVRLVPGDPAALLLGADSNLAAVEALREEMGLNEPLLVQYVTYIGDVLRLDFGSSTRLGGDAIDHVFSRAPATARLALTSMTIAIVVSFPLGILAARRPQRVVDRIISSTSLVGQALPTFWVGIMLILVFARYLNVMPSAGSGTWRHLVMPGITLALPFMSILIRLVRGGLMEVLHEDYVRTARSKGLKERRVLYVHAVRNMLIPVVTVVGLQFGLVLGGAVIVETVFSWPGIGRLLVDSISNRDYSLVQASVALIAAVFVFLNLVVDVLYGYLDPRIKLGVS